MVQEPLIYSDLLIFSIGNVIADTSIAFLAILTWKMQLFDNRYYKYSEELSIDYIKDKKDYSNLMLAYHLNDEKLLDDIDLLDSTDDKNYLLKLIKTKQKIIMALNTLIYCLIAGIFIQISALITPQYGNIIITIVLIFIIIFFLILLYRNYYK